ncbi:uncharacterized protein N7459_003369 [Penicillium hispanicum]|uniref:uncharacterized protein n=1 Tax=Penicillium hispanicum TaxID=1080232 RepID=UPI002541B6B4|nr:uncharacterized protein N7459_003369 [Penicillium hispanicum]KAJ5587604.1 hypothetical protein N7459_003369 [Penicillium hispanicum]
MIRILHSLLCLPRRRWSSLDSKSDDERANRLQCDEKRPVCTNCANHDINCTFATDPASETPSPAALSPESVGAERSRPRRFQPYKYSTGELRQTFKLSKAKKKNNSPQSLPESDSAQCDPPSTFPATISLADLQLFHHYTISTYKTMRDEDPHNIWQDHLVQWGIQFPSILHLILALSALHLAHDQPASRAQYIQQADDHFTFGIRSVTSVLSQLDAENCQRIYMAAVLICFVYFGRGPREGEYLIFSDHGPSEWLVLMRGVRLILASYYAQVFTGILDPHSAAEEDVCTIVPEMSRELQEHTLHIVDVRRVVDDLVRDETCRAMYLAAMEDLLEVLRQIYETVSAGKTGVRLMHWVIGWLYRRPEEFVHALEQKEPPALAVLASWAVLLKYMESTWFMEGWAGHVLTGISGSLPSEFRSWIEWPLQKVQHAK